MLIYNYGGGNHSVGRLQRYAIGLIGKTCIGLHFVNLNRSSAMLHSAQRKRIFSLTVTLNLDVAP